MHAAWSHAGPRDILPLMPKYVVRHGVMRNLSVLGTRAGETYARGMQVIVRTQRGIEAGEVLCEATEHVLENMTDPKGGQILHEQSEEDKREIRRLAEQEEREHKLCSEIIAQLNLDMKLIDIERLFGGERVVVYYLAEDRVDFAQNVKDGGNEFKTRN